MSLATGPAHADVSELLSFEAYVDAVGALQKHEVTSLALTLGVLLFAVVTAIALVRTRLRAAAAEGSLRDKIAGLRAERDRVNALLLSEPQIVVSWAAADNDPELLGDTALVPSGPVPQRVLAFGTWLEPDKAQAMEHAVDALRAHGESFSTPLITTGGRTLEADVRRTRGRAALRLRDASRRN